MKPTALLTALLASAVTCAAAESHSVPIYVQPITVPETPPALLAEFTYETEISSTTSPEKQQMQTQIPDTVSIKAHVSAYEAPEFPESARLVRIGHYDKAATRWVSSTAVLSVQNFGKGYAPHFVLTLDESAVQVLGVACRGVRVDAGYTRDFGPQVRVVLAEAGKQPELNRPVVLSAEGKQVVAEEKSFWQKYVFLFSFGSPCSAVANGYGVVGTGGRLPLACSCLCPAVEMESEVDKLGMEQQ